MSRTTRYTFLQLNRWSRAHHSWIGVRRLRGLEAPLRFRLRPSKLSEHSSPVPAFLEFLQTWLPSRKLGCLDARRDTGGPVGILLLSHSLLRQCGAVSARHLTEVHSGNAHATCRGTTAIVMLPVGLCQRSRIRAEGKRAQTNNPPLHSSKNWSPINSQQEL